MLQPHVRWMIRRDLPEVLAIEAASFEFAWSEEDFLRALRQRNCIGMVAEINGDAVIGYMVYELHKYAIAITNMAVEPHFRRRGVGRAMVTKLKSKLSSHRRTSIDVLVRETNLAGQLFLRDCGFRAELVLPNHYEADTDEAAYKFTHRIPVESAVMLD